MIIQNMTKGTALNVVMHSSVAFSSATAYTIIPGSQNDLDGGTAQISKDDGTFSSLTNSAVYIGPGIWSIQLTAEEMDADKIDVVYHDNVGNKFSGMVTIFTGTSGSSAIGVSNFSPDLLDFLVTSINSNYFLREVDLDLSTYNYYGFAKTSSVWVIVRENKATLALTYAIRQSGVNDKRFNQVWNQKTNLDYTSSAPF